jgi:type I restriction enzyme M protein
MLPLVTLEEVAANDYNRNIPCYVEPKVHQDVLTVDEAMQRLQASAVAAFAEEDKFMAMLKREGLLQCIRRRPYLRSASS